MKALVIALAMCSAVSAQSKGDLKKKYGEPVAQTFVIRPGIVVTASHNTIGQITELVISPQLTDLIKSRSKGLSHEVVKEVIDELVPISERGRGLEGGFLNIGCAPQNDCYGSYESYDRVIIYYNAGHDGDINYAVVQWKK